MSGTPTPGAWPGKAVAPTTILTVQGLVGSLNGPAPEAPSAFAVSGGTVYVFVPPTHSLRSYVRGRLTASAVLPDITVRDLLVSGRTASVLSTQNQVRTFTLAGSKATQMGAYTVKTSGGDQITHFQSDGGRIYAATDDDKRVSLTSATVSPAATAASGLAMADDGFTVTTAAGDKLAISVPYSPGGIKLLYRGGGRVFYEAWNEHDSASGAWVSDRYVFEYTDAGHLVSTFTLTAVTTAVPSRDLLVADGSVYQLFIDGATTKVLTLAPDAPTSVMATPAAAGMPSTATAPATKG